MNKIKSIFFISFLAVSSASLAEHTDEVYPDTHDIGGCTQASLGPAYHPDLCNSDGTYNKNASKHHLFSAIHQINHVNEILNGIPGANGGSLEHSNSNTVIHIENFHSYTHSH